MIVQPDADHADLAGLVSAMPFAGLLGISLEATAADEVRGRMAWDETRCTAGGVLHGGALMGFADTIGAICAFLNLPAGASTATLGSTTNLFRPVRQGEVRGVSRPLHVGRSTIVVQTDLYDDRDRRVTQTTQTQAVLPGS